MKCQDFRMGLPGLMMIGFAYDAALIDDHRAHHGVGVRLPFSPSRQGKGTFHVKTIRWDGGHRRVEEVEDFLRGTDFAIDFFFPAGFLAIVFLVVGFFVLAFFLATGFVDLVVVACFFLVDFLAER